MSHHLALIPHPRVLLFNPFPGLRGSVHLADKSSRSRQTCIFSDSEENLSLSKMRASTIGFFCALVVVMVASVSSLPTRSRHQKEENGDTAVLQSLREDITNPVSSCGLECSQTSCVRHLADRVSIFTCVRTQLAISLTARISDCQVCICQKI